MVRGLWVVAERALDLGDSDGLVDSKRQERSPLGGVELTVEAQRDVRREREARARVCDAALLDPLVQLAKRSVRVQREDDDVGLHEPNGTVQGKRERWRRARDRLEHDAKVRDRCCGSDRPGAGRADDRDVRRHESRELRIEASLNLSYQGGERRLERRDDVDTRPRPPSTGRFCRGPTRLSLHRMLGAMAR